jgi:hypothetical protein
MAKKTAIVSQPGTLPFGCLTAYSFSTEYLFAITENTWEEQEGLEQF